MKMCGGGRCVCVWRVVGVCVGHLTLHVYWHIRTCYVWVTSVFAVPVGKLMDPYHFLFCKHRLFTNRRD